MHQVTQDSVVHDSITDQDVFEDAWGVYEIYWYDALGRRVMKASLQGYPYCTHPDRCHSSIERYVWDGEHILWELRQDDLFNTDIQHPTGSPFTGQTGTIGYVHAGGIDAPLAMIRNGESITLHRNWRGLYAFATDVDGNQVTCAPEPFPGCNQVSWPGINWNLQQAHVDPREVEPWYGSLPMGQQDRSGLAYKRNRYYDPEAGQFTQEDPIGLAGGLNLYGFADGDPINFSDPFGLCVEEPDEDDFCEELVALLRTISSDDDIFAQAADALDKWTGGKVNIVSQSFFDDPPRETTYGRVRGNMYLSEEQSSGEFLVTLVHESMHLPTFEGRPPRGLHSTAEGRAAFYRAEVAAVRGLPSKYSAIGHWAESLPYWYRWLQGRGVSVPTPPR